MIPRHHGKHNPPRTGSRQLSITTIGQRRTNLPHYTSLPEFNTSSRSTILLYCQTHYPSCVHTHIHTHTHTHTHTHIYIYIYIYIYILHIILYYHIKVQRGFMSKTDFGIILYNHSQRCTNPVFFVVLVSIFFGVAPKNCGSSLWKFLNITLLTSGFLGGS